VQKHTVINAAVQEQSGMVIIEGCFTELKLADALKQIVGNAWAGGQVTLPQSRRRWDMAYKQ
jgi:hypothetical protein